jgi:hypothetical protein
MEPVRLLGRLQGSSDSLGNLIQRAERVSELNRLLKQWTREPWLEAIRLVNVRGTVAVVFADNAAALVPLRYRSESLLRFLRDELGLDVNRIDAKVRPAAAYRQARV